MAHDKDEDRKDEEGRGEEGRDAGHESHGKGKKGAKEPVLNQYVLKCGSHSEPLPEGGFATYDAAPEDSEEVTIIESEHDLVAGFGKGRFQRLPKGGSKASLPHSKQPPMPGHQGKGEQHIDLAGPFGDDVTEQFESAATHDLRVFQDEKGYTVTKDSDRSKKLNDAPLKDSRKVEKFLTNYTASHMADQR